MKTLIQLFDSKRHSCFVGARTDLRNNERKTPYELAKDPETAVLLQRSGLYLRAREWWNMVLYGCV
jgi:hypothetical protein